MKQIFNNLPKWKWTTRVFKQTLVFLAAIVVFLQIFGEFVFMVFIFVMSFVQPIFAGAGKWTIFFGVMLMLLYAALRPLFIKLQGLPKAVLVLTGIVAGVF